MVHAGVEYSLYCILDITVHFYRRWRHGVLPGEGYGRVGYRTETGDGEDIMDLDRIRQFKSVGV
jgi:hypothetical protein